MIYHDFTKDNGNTSANDERQIIFDNFRIEAWEEREEEGNDEQDEWHDAEEGDFELAAANPVTIFDSGALLMKFDEGEEHRQVAKEKTDKAEGEEGPEEVSDFREEFGDNDAGNGNN